jgi:hypothetical protein
MISDTMPPCDTCARLGCRSVCTECYESHTWDAYQKRSLKHRIAKEWPVVAVAVFWAIIVAFALLHTWGCGATTYDVLTGMTKAATATAPTMSKRISAEEDACFGDARPSAEVELCVTESRTKWAPVLTAYATIIATDETALAGSPDLVSIVAAYCQLGKAVPELPAMPSSMGVCQ